MGDVSIELSPNRAQWGQYFQMPHDRRTPGSSGFIVGRLIVVVAVLVVGFVPSLAYGQAPTEFLLQGTWKLEEVIVTSELLVAPRSLRPDGRMIFGGTTYAMVLVEPGIAQSQRPSTLSGLTRVPPDDEWGIVTLVHAGTYRVTGTTLTLELELTGFSAGGGDPIVTAELELEGNTLWMTTDEAGEKRRRFVRVE